MSNESKMRIICDPFKKEIGYQWYDYYLNDYVEFDPENSKLANDELVNTTIQNRAYEIAEVINSECNVGNVGLEIVFVGTVSDYEDFCKVIDTHYGECNIKCIRDSHYYNSAAEVMPEIKERFEDVKTTLDEYKEDDITTLISKYNDAVKPSISLCVMGLYSAGKSAFINSIIGAEILPSASDPTTAKVCKIKCSKNYRITFQFDGKDCVLNFIGGDYRPNNNCDRDIIKKLQDIVDLQEQRDEAHHMNAALSIINNYNDEKHEISDMIVIEVPFVKTKLPVSEFDFVIYDTPGSNSENNEKHFEVLRDSLDEQTNALPIFLTTPDTMDVKDNNEIIDLIKDKGAALDTTNAIMVVNRSDEKGPNDLRKKRGKCGKLKITQWKSTRIFFVSSVIGIACKKENPDDPEQWIDEDMYEKYDEKKDKYANDNRKLYEFNIVDKSKIDEIEGYGDDAMTTHLYKNSGLEAVEREIAEYAQRYALYNKCSQASSYLQEAIDKCVDNIQEVEQQLIAALDEAKKNFDTKQKELCSRLENKKKDIAAYNTEFQKVMQEKFKSYTVSHNIVDGNLDAQRQIRDELKIRWTQYREEEKKDKLKKGTGWALRQIQIYVEDFYNNLLEDFCTYVNRDIFTFWDNKSKIFKNNCIEIVRGSKALTPEQKMMLESIVLSKNNMPAYKITFNLRNVGAISHKRFLFWKLKSEKFDVYICVFNIVRKFYDMVRWKINSTVSGNEKNFKRWTDELISKLVEELCKFNPELDAANREIAKYKDEINAKNECAGMLGENKRHIESLLDIQGGKDDE